MQFGAWPALRGGPGYRQRRPLAGPAVQARRPAQRACLAHRHDAAQHMQHVYQHQQAQ